MKTLSYVHVVGRSLPSMPMCVIVSILVMAFHENESLAFTTRPVPVRCPLQLFANNHHINVDHSTWWKQLTTSTAIVALGAVLMSPLPAEAVMTIDTEDASQGLSVVTQSDLGKSIRKAVIGSAQLADQWDLQWERFSDSLRDEAKCDPRTNRRLFDNGFRRDGVTRIGNPVLGALCTPEPLGPLQMETARGVLDSAKDSLLSLPILGPSTTTTLDKKIIEVEQLVGPSFARAVSETKDDQSILRQTFNKELYVTLRAMGESTTSWTKETSREFQVTWGDKLLMKLAPNANRNDYTSPFPPPDDKDNQPYDEGSLLDILGRISVALRALQSGGLIGHWEISIPEDDDWNVVTIAIDDDITIGGQILAKERNQPLDGSFINSIVRAAMEHTTKEKITYKMDVFFIDPTTTKQELYNPTQLLISLSDLGQ